jgi:hypothetical protein
MQLSEDLTGSRTRLSTGGGVGRSTLKQGIRDGDYGNRGSSKATSIDKVERGRRVHAASYGTGTG